jgi:hypothetical protein
MEAYAQQMRGQNIEREAEEARKTLELQTQHEKHREEYRDQLERKRQVDMLNAQKYMQEYVGRRRRRKRIVVNLNSLSHFVCFLLKRQRAVEETGRNGSTSGRDASSYGRI